jgi:hypothetical protein
MVAQPDNSARPETATTAAISDFIFGLSRLRFRV